MALPKAYDLELYRGDSFAAQITLWADPAKTEPADLTGAVAAAEIRKGHATTPAIALVCVITDNVIDVSLTAADSLDVPALGYWDLQITYLSGGVQTILRGDVHVTGDITGSTVGLTAQAAGR
jgi:hypothetical protein